MMQHSRDVRWWETRRDNETTADYLGRVLDAAGLPDMGRAAKRADYDDYFCSLESDYGDNMVRLVLHLQDAARNTTSRDQREQILAVRRAAVDGEFDGTRQESERWFASKDGQDAMNLLGGMMNGKPQ